MSELELNEKEREFVAQSELFVRRAVAGTGIRDLSTLVPRDVLPVWLRPTQLRDYRALSEREMDQLVEDYQGEHGVAYFIVENPDAPGSRHPLLMVADQLRERLGLQFPIDHPMESHPEAIQRFGLPDGTLKLYDLRKDPASGYREQAETSERFAAHNDGLGYAGAVRTVIMYLDSPPLWGGLSYFVNLVRLSLDLLRIDPEAFRSLFLPDAITAIRPRGKGAIKVTSPVLFVNQAEEPQAFYRVASGEYRITYRRGIGPLDRAMTYLSERAVPFGPGTSMLSLADRGHGCIVRNQWVVHGRTEFIDSGEAHRRVIARKWYMSGSEHVKYKHVPGMMVHSRYAALYPELFGPDMLMGEWAYDAGSGSNKRNR